jgi:hypothetical protein
MKQAAELFLDPGKTSRIVCEQYGIVHEYEGFTNCTNLFTEAEGRISVCLMRGNANV